MLTYRTPNNPTLADFRRIKNHLIAAVYIKNAIYNCKRCLQICTTGSHSLSSTAVTEMTTVIVTNVEQPYHPTQWLFTMACKVSPWSVFLIQSSLCRRWIPFQPLRRTNWAFNQFTTAVRTVTGKVILCTVIAECAFVAAHSSYWAIGRQIHIATFAVGFHFKHVW